MALLLWNNKEKKYEFKPSSTHVNKIKAKLRLTSTQNHRQLEEIIKVIP